MGTQFIRPSVRQRMRAARLTSARVFAAVLGVALAATMNAEPALAGSAGGSVPGRVRIEVLDRAAGGPLGADAVLLRIGSVDTSSAAAAAGGQVSLSVGYAAFRYAYGGDWANRLRLVRLPGCALTTPAAAGCRGVPLPSRNDSVAGTVTADVPVTALPAAGMAASPDRVVEAAAGQGAVYALDASTSGSTGDFSATNLAPSSTWTAGGSTGDFAWSYPMREPPAMGGPTTRSCRWPAIRVSSSTTAPRGAGTSRATTGPASSGSPTPG